MVLIIVMAVIALVSVVVISIFAYKENAKTESMYKDFESRLKALKDMKPSKAKKADT